VFYLAVVLEKGQVVDCSLDPENEAELVVQFQRYRPNGVFDPRPFDTDVETISHLTLVHGAQLAAQKGGDVIRLDSMNRRARQILVDRL
jgi:hypothetical protein